ncbi:MAG: hypothetical protein JO356_01390 [Acidobacteria bacterium]|nr:hypothetical protein [Acidobacteriota bacterium]
MPQKIEALIAEIESLGDQRVRHAMAELLESLLSFHGTALQHLLEALRGDRLSTKISEIAEQDAMVSALLLLHGLHPVATHVRVAQALRTIEPYLRSAGYELEKISSEQQPLRVWLKPRGGGGGSPIPLKHLILEAISGAAPEVDEIRIEGLEEPTRRKPSTFIPLASLKGGSQ